MTMTNLTRYSLGKRMCLIIMMRYVVGYQYVM